MADSSNKFSRFLQELKRRKTDRVIVMYAAAAFAILQLADILQGGLSMPDWIMTLLIIIFAAGFPVVAIFSWFFDITPQGIEKTKPMTRIRRNKMEAQLRTWKETTMISVIVIIALIIFNIVRGNIQSSEIRTAAKTIAVLPFDNMVPNEIFPHNTNTIPALIISELRKIKVLQVTARWEVNEFVTQNKSVAEIAKKLDVSFLVTGEIINIKNIVLITVNLIKADRKKPRTIWTDEFSIDPNGNYSELLDIPIKIGNQLKILLSAEEKSRIKKKPTMNTAAFFNFLEGTTYQDDAHTGDQYLSMNDSIFNDLSTAKSFNLAMFFYDKAIEADSTFAIAYAKRAITRALGYRGGYFTAGDHMEKCLSDIKRALYLDKDLTEARIAYGFYYYYFAEDFIKALEYFREVSEREPYNCENNFYMAIVLRAMGEWEQSQAKIKQVVKYNFKNPLFLTNIGLSYQALHQYDTAIYFHDKAIERMPEWSPPYTNKIQALLSRDGNTIEAGVVLQTAVKRTTGGFFPYIEMILSLYSGRYQEALLKAEVADSSDFPDPGWRILLLADIHKNLNNHDLARSHYKSAFEYYTKLLAENPDDPEFLSLVGIAAAGLKERAKALEAGQNALDITRYNGLEKSDRMLDLANIYVVLGEYDKALDLIEELLKNPSSLSPGLLKLDPVWKPLSGRSRFKAILEKYTTNG